MKKRIGTMTVSWQSYEEFCLLFDYADHVQLTWKENLTVMEIFLRS